jgi:hypothetical protein
MVDLVHVGRDIFAQKIPKCRRYVARLTLNAKCFKKPSRMTTATPATVQIDRFTGRRPGIEPLQLTLDCRTSANQRKPRFTQQIGAA